MKPTPTKTLERIAEAMRRGGHYEGSDFAAHLSGELQEIQKGLPTGQQSKVRSMCNAARRASGARPFHAWEWEE